MNELIQSATRLQLLQPDLTDATLGLIKSTAMLLIAAGIAAMIRSASGRNWIWRCALTALCALMLWQSLPSWWTERWMTWRVDVTYATVASPILSDIATTNGMGATPERLENRGGTPLRHHGDWGKLVVSFWKWTAALLLTLHIARSIAGGWWLRRHSYATAGKYQGVETRVCASIETPLLAGWFRPVIYLPENAVQWTDAQKQSVMLHEFAHWSRKDVCWQDAGTLAACLWWWNPLAWFALKRMKAEAEQAADDIVILQQGEPERYARLLVEMASTSPVASRVGVPVLGQSSLDQRIRRILLPNLPRGKIGGWSAGMLGTLGAVFVLCVSANVVLGERNVKNDRGEVILFQASDPKKNVLLRGDFLKAGANLQGWAGDLKAVSFPETGVVRLDPGAIVEMTLPRDPGWKWLTVSARTRPGPSPKGRPEGSVIFTQLDASGNVVGTSVDVKESERGDYTNWANRIRSVELESTTKTLRVVMKAPAEGGSLDVSEVLVMPASLDEEPDHNQVQLFYKAVKDNDISTVKAMLAKDPKLLESRNGSNDNGTPLIACAWRDLPEMAQVLIDQGANLEALDSNWKSTPLTWCGWWGSPKTAAVLLKAGANPKFRSIYGVTPASSAKSGKTANRASKSTPEAYDETISLLDSAAKR